MKKILVVNGPNLNLLGEREQEIYGSKSLNEIKEALLGEAAKVQVDLEFFQSNHEGELISKIHSARGQIDVIIINPGAFTHYSYALRDALEAVKIPSIEVHLSNIYAREEWRKTSVTAPVAKGIIAGFGPNSYLLAFQAALMLKTEG